MELRVLGPVAAVVDGRPVDLGRPKQRALLALLLAAADRVVAVDTITELLWAGEPPARATAGLQAYVSRLRRLLEPDRAPGATPAVLVTAAPGYVLRTAGIAVDAREFTGCAARGRAALDAGAPADALAELDAALGFWRGEPYADLRDADWVRPEAARLAGLRLAAVEDRAEALTGVGRPAEAAAELEAHVLAHPLRERGWQLLARALYRAGRQGDALAALRAARARLADELGVDPGPELRRLEEAVLRQDPALLDPAPFPSARARSAAAGPAPTAVSGSTPAPVPAVSADPRPFVGRADALGVLRGVGGDLLAGRGGVVLVDGDPGIGKTRLVERFAAEVGAPVLWGRCPDHEVAPPLWPWEQVLRAVGRDRAPGPELAALLGGPDAPPAGLDPAGARLRLYEAVTAHLAAAAPVVVVLDDLHWADAASLRLLVHLAQSAPPVLVVATFRRHEAAGLVDALAALARVGARRVHLGGLGPTEVRELVEALAGADPGPGGAAALGARTGGNPFFLGELARLPGLGAADAVPEPVREVVLRRVDRLPEQAGALLATAAVAGLEFDAPAVLEVAGQDPEAGLDLLDSALAAGLLVEDPDRLGSFRFAHALVRDALAGRHSRLRRARLHRRFGEVTARRWAGRADRAGQVARHWLAAAELDPATAATAVEHAVRAARAAEARLAHEDAVGLWQEAMAAAELAGGGVERVDRFELLLGLTGAQHAAGDVADGLALLDEVLAAAGTEPRRVVRAAVAAFGPSIWYPFPYGSRPERLLGALQDAVGGLEVASADRALGTAALAAVRAHVGDFAAASPLAAAAADEARTLGDPVLLARVLHLGLLSNNGVDGESASWADAAELAALPGAPPELAASARIHVVAGLLATGRMAEAEALLDRLEPELAALRSPLLVHQATSQRAALLTLRGELDAADALWAAALAEAGESGHSGLVPSWLGHRVAVAWQRGTLAALGPDLAGAVAATGMRAFGPTHALALVAAGQPDDARRVLAEVPPPPRDYTWLAAAVGRLAAAVALGDAGLVAGIRPQLLPFRDRMAISGTGIAIFGCVAGHLGEAALVIGDRAAARAELTAAVELLDRVGAPYWEARARQALGKLDDPVAGAEVKGPASAAGDPLRST